MISVVTIGAEYVAPDRKEFIIDSTSDVANLPTITKSGNLPGASSPCAPGSVAYTPDLVNIYVLGNDDAWHKA